jgi:hypothetical protein
LFALFNKPVMICDPLHLLKRIRYPSVASVTFFLGSTHQKVHFSPNDIPAAGIRSLLVFPNSRVNAMHNSLPLQLFSPNTFSRISQSGIANQLLMMTWCLLTSSLTGILDACRDLKDNCHKQWQISDRPQTGRDLSFDTLAQVRGSGNPSPNLRRPICFNRVGSNPLEHAFGKARIRCRDVNSMRRMLTALATEAMTSFAK